MLQTLNFTAGGRQIDAKANFFRFESCNAVGADESVRVRADGNDLGLFLPGDYVDLPTYATRWEIVPVTVTATGTVRLGVGKVGSSRLTGNVRIIDSASDKTLAGLQFMGTISQAASVGNVSVVGISKGSSNRFAVKRLILGSSTSGGVHVLTGTGGGTATPSVGGLPNKFIGQSSSPMNATLGYAVAYPFTGAELPGFAYGTLVQVSAGVPFVLDFVTPLIVSGTFILCVAPAAANRDLQVTFDIEQIV